MDIYQIGALWLSVLLTFLSLIGPHKDPPYTSVYLSCVHIFHIYNTSSNIYYFSDGAIFDFIRVCRAESFSNLKGIRTVVARIIPSITIYIQMLIL